MSNGNGAEQLHQEDFANWHPDKEEVTSIQRPQLDTPIKKKEGEKPNPLKEVSDDEIDELMEDILPAEERKDKIMAGGAVAEARRLQAQYEKEGKTFADREEKDKELSAKRYTEITQTLDEMYAKDPERAKKLKDINKMIAEEL